MLKISINLIRTIPKQRPKFNRRNGNAYHDTRYTDFLNAVRTVFESLDQHSKDSLRNAAKHGLIHFEFHLHINRKIDLDNTLGTVLDGMVKAKILEDDSIKYLVRYYNDCFEIPRTESEKLVLKVHNSVYDFAKHLLKIS